MPPGIPYSIYFKYDLIAGRMYRFAFETKFTQASFADWWQNWYYYIWSPTNWPDHPGNPTYHKGYNVLGEGAGANEDVEPYWCPYPDKLNEAFPSGPDIFYDGGMRLEFIATETGEWIFMILAYEKAGYLPETPDFGFVVYEVVGATDTSERDIVADPGEGLSPLGVQFKDIEAE